MAIEFARDLHQVIKERKIESNLKGVALGDAWISPVDSNLAMAPYMLNLGIIDHDGFHKINKIALKLVDQIIKRNFEDAAWTEYSLHREMLKRFVQLNYYNVLSRSKFENASNHRDKIGDPGLFEMRELGKIMKNQVHRALGLDERIRWGSQSADVKKSLWLDEMESSVGAVADVLNNTAIKVVVYNGQLDLICSTPGQVNWINKMQWKDKEKYLNSARVPFIVDGYLEGYKRSYNKFSMYWVNFRFKKVCAEIYHY